MSYFERTAYRENGIYTEWIKEAALHEANDLTCLINRLLGSPVTEPQGDRKAKGIMAENQSI